MQNRNGTRRPHSTVIKTQAHADITCSLFNARSFHMSDRLRRSIVALLFYTMIRLINEDSFIDIVLVTFKILSRCCDFLNLYIKLFSLLGTIYSGSVDLDSTDSLTWYIYYKSIYVMEALLTVSDSDKCLYVASWHLIQLQAW